MRLAAYLHREMQSDPVRRLDPLMVLVEPRGQQLFRDVRIGIDRDEKTVVLESGCEPPVDGSVDFGERDVPREHILPDDLQDGGALLLFSFAGHSQADRGGVRDIAEQIEHKVVFGRFAPHDLEDLAPTEGIGP